jgi:hypothetical protein
VEAPKRDELFNIQWKGRENGQWLMINCLGVVVNGRLILIVFRV